MSKIIDKVEAASIFKELRNLTSSGDIAKLKQRYNLLMNENLELDFKSEEEVEFIDEPSQYTQLIQHNDILIADHVVYQWEVTYFGYYGGGGAGWFVEEEENLIDVDVYNLLIELGIYLDTPDVPKPEIDDEEVED
jgi:hypothetical protein